MSLRERKKQEMRKSISGLAFALFAERGFDAVTVAEVADAAGVSEKTVFNYFACKEDIVFDEVPEREEALVRAVRGRDSGESVLASLRRSQLGECKRMSSPDFAVFARIIDESPSLRAKELEVMARFERVLAEALQEELGIVELEARVAATLLIGVHRHFFQLARERTRAGKQGPAAARRLRADLERAYALLERGLGDLG